MVPDNLRSAVSRAHRYEPDLNPTDADLAEHYGFVVIPAPSSSSSAGFPPRDATAPSSRWPNSTAPSPSCSHGSTSAPSTSSRAFESTDRPALRALPAEPCVFAQWKKVRVRLDSHVELDRHDCSAPLVGRPLLARYTAHTVEFLDRGQRVASHRRSHQPGRHPTIPEHMPEPHRRFAQQDSPERFPRLELARFRGPLTLWGGGVHHAEIETAGHGKHVVTGEDGEEWRKTLIRHRSPCGGALV